MSGWATCEWLEHSEIRARLDVVPGRRADAQRQTAVTLGLHREYGFRGIPDCNGNLRAEIRMEATL